MPLEKWSSKAAFEQNIKTEMAAGKPQDQALAIAYSQKRGDGETIPAGLNAEKLDAINGRLDDVDKRFHQMIVGKAPQNA